MNTLYRQRCRLMAKRPVFLSIRGESVYVRSEAIEFRWYPGLSLAQKRQSIVSLHENAKQRLGIQAILEISSKSEALLGRQLSAFQLRCSGPEGQRVTVESLYQGSKVFENGGPYTDLYGADPKKAKQDARLIASGALVAFQLQGKWWPLTPRTLFYDWVYLNALTCNPGLASALLAYDAFTDIEFNPQKSYNCQAHSAALYVQLVHADLLEKVLASPEAFQAHFNSIGNSQKV